MTSCVRAGTERFQHLVGRRRCGALSRGSREKERPTDRPTERESDAPTVGTRTQEHNRRTRALSRPQTSPTSRDQRPARADDLVAWPSKAVWRSALGNLELEGASEVHLDDTNRSRHSKMVPTCGEDRPASGTTKFGGSGSGSTMAEIRRNMDSGLWFLCRLADRALSILVLTLRGCGPTAHESTAASAAPKISVAAAVAGDSLVGVGAPLTLVLPCRSATRQVPKVRSIAFCSRAQPPGR